MIKIITISLTCFFLTLSVCNASDTHTRYVFFINQVRGTECCEPGSIDALDSQLAVFDKYQYPATFAFRYDALNDEQLVSTIKNNPQNHEIAGMLEIIPSLPQTAGVDYNGNLNTWYRANQAFLIGYSPTDRLKIIDAYMAKFHQVFGYYPQTTVAWMIDATSLNYLHDKYHVKVHQLTREQWGTDSYTMYGGPFHYPYKASRNWPLIPATENTDSPIIIRQTIADPLRNYGDRDSAFTSQPNDYIRDNKNISYFKNLLHQSLNQTTNPYSLVVLGLETSMSPEIQTAYMEQVDYVNEYSAKYPLSVITPAQIGSDNSFILPLSIVEGKNLVDSENLTAIWVNSTNYRLRFLVTNQHLYLSDARFYHPQITDPYKNQANNSTNGYWITPFIVDHSRFGDFKPIRSKTHKELKNISIPNIKQFIHKLLVPINTDPVTSIGTALNPQNDFLTQTEANSLLKINSFPNIVWESGGVRFKFSNSPHQLDFYQDKWIINFPFKNPPTIAPVNFKPEINSWSFTHNNQPLWGFNVIENKGLTTFTPFVNKDLNFENIYKQQAFYLSPNQTEAVVSLSHTAITLHNQRAIAGRNPIRVFIKPSSDAGLPTSIKNTSVKFIKDNHPSVDVSPPGADLGTYWLDISSSQPGTYPFQLNLDGQTTPIYSAIFAPDCRQNIKYCLTHPASLWQYFLTILEDKTRE